MITDRKDDDRAKTKAQMQKRCIIADIRNNMRNDITEGGENAGETLSMRCRKIRMNRVRKSSAKKN